MRVGSVSNGIFTTDGVNASTREIAASTSDDSPPFMPYQVKLLDAQATTLYEGEAQNGTLRIDVRSLRKGMYYLHIYKEDHSAAKMPLLIE